MGLAVIGIVNHFVDPGFWDWVPGTEQGQRCVAMTATSTRPTTVMRQRRRFMCLAVLDPSLDCRSIANHSTTPIRAPVSSLLKVGLLLNRI